MCYLSTLSREQRPETPLAQATSKDVVDVLVTGTLTNPYYILFPELFVTFEVEFGQEACEEIFMSLVVSVEDSCVLAALRAALS